MATLIEGKTAWEFACDWYTSDQIASSIRNNLRLVVMPGNVESPGFAEWLTEQYRLAMAKGIEIGQRASARARAEKIAYDIELLQERVATCEEARVKDQKYYREKLDMYRQLLREAVKETSGSSNVCCGAWVSADWIRRAEKEVGGDE